MNTNSALIVSAQPTNQVELKFHEAINPPLEIFDIWLLVWIGLGLLIAAIIAFFLWRHWRKKASAISLPPAIPPHDRARRRLEEALALLAEPKPFSIMVSDILRVYIEERFSFHAPDRTTEEFLFELQGTELLTVSQKQSLAEFLSSCDLVKFAKYEPTEMELRALHDSALRLVNETEPPPMAFEAAASQAASRAPQPAIK